MRWTAERGGCHDAGMTAGWAIVPVVAVAAIWLALAWDRLWGEPSARWHPVVWIGHYLAWCGRRIAPRAETRLGTDYPAFFRGAVCWCAGAAVAALLAAAVQTAARALPAWGAALLLGVALKPLLAWRMLRDEVLSVERGLAVSLDTGRARLSLIVSRDVTQLSDSEVRESALESLAENLSDSVIAPLFWFVLLGLPGAALYRFANTADAMWGYHGVRGGRVWEWAGKWAARADDLLSWAPSRLTALLLAAAALRWPRGGLRREAHGTPSPNSGWPMAAMALLLDVRLGKPDFYALNEYARAPEADDTRRALRLAGRSVLAGALLCSAALLGAGCAAAR